MKADVFRAKDVVDMLLDDEEEEDLKANQSRFLKTGRGRRPKAKPADDHMTIDTSSKKKTSPVKPSGTTTQTIRSSDLVKANPGKKVADKMFSTLKEGVQNIFATSKQQHARNDNLD